MNGTVRLILTRLLQLPLILVAVYTITFTLAWLVPGNPLDGPEGRRPPEAVAEAMQRQYDLDDPVRFWWQYLGKASGLSWALGHHDRPFDLGPSLAHENWTVGEIIGDGLPVSATVGLSAITIALGLGLGAGIAGATRPGTRLDAASLGCALVGISVPTFVTGALLLGIVGAKLRWVPIGGWGSPAHLLLPALTLSLPFAAYIARLTRFALLEAYASDHVRAARARGIGERAILVRHALRGALIPVAGYMGPAAAIALTGSFVVERVFAVPGIGTHFVNAVLSKDLTLVMGVVLVFATLLVLFNLLVDVVLRWLDPRIADAR
ncbi:MAG: ABC transporter permease [Phycisphaerales bacterium]